MKNSNSQDVKNKTLKVLGKLSSRLDTSRIAHAFDQVLDRYIGHYRIPTNHAEFNREIALFLQAIYVIGVNPSKILTALEATAKAISLLSQYSNNQGARGYEAAYLDAVFSGEEGIGDVCFKLSQIVKESEIRKYRDYVYATTIDPSDWELHINLTASIIELYGEFLPPLIRESPPVRFSRLYKDLIEMVLSSQDLAAKISSGSYPSFHN